jgi:hypothetical protein
MSDGVSAQCATPADWAIIGLNQHNALSIKQIEVLGSVQKWLLSLHLLTIPFLAGTGGLSGRRKIDLGPCGDDPSPMAAANIKRLRLIRFYESPGTHSLYATPP